MSYSTIKRIAAIMSTSLLLVACAGCADGTDESASEAYPVQSEVQTASTETQEPDQETSAQSEIIIPSQEDVTLPDVVDYTDPAADETDVPYEGGDNEYSRALAKKNQEYEPGSGEITRIFTSKHDKKDYTLMIYMVGSNLESTLGAASADIREMEASGLTYDDVNLILYTGGSARWQSFVPCDSNCVIDMSLPVSERVVARTLRNADMGAPETLRSFVNFATEMYPAQHYALIMWDHGGGPLWGFGCDELFGGDGLLLSEMKDAMNGTIFAGAPQLDFVGFDACLMGNIETMTAWSDYADYYIGSEELEPGDGWDYHFLSVLNVSRDVLTVGSRIIDSFRDYYDVKRSAYYDPDVTLSMADLSKTGAVQSALSRVSNEMTGLINRGGFTGLSQARTQALSFGATGRAEDPDAFYYDLVDAKSFAGRLGESTGINSAPLSDSIDALIVKNYSNVEGAGGATVYYPSGNRSQYYEMRDIYFGLGINRDYQNLLRNVSRKWQTGRKNDWRFSQPAATQDGYELAIDGDVLEKMVSASYDIIAQTADGSYYRLKSHCAVWPDDDGVIRLPADPVLVAMVTEGEEALWPVTETESGERRRIYTTCDTRLSTGGINFYDRPTTDAVSISAVLQEDIASGEVFLKTVNGAAQEVEASGKQTVDAEHYDGVFYYYYDKLPVWSADGELLPVSEWKDGDVNATSFHALSRTFSFKGVRASEVCESLYYVLTIEDAAGNLYVADLTPIEPRRAFDIVSVPTDKGSMECCVYSDHAKIISYSGNDTSLNLPGYVNGVPVTEIGPDAFSRHMEYDENPYYPVRTVVIPDSVTDIGARAFYYCLDLESITLPAGLKMIGPGAFASCEKLNGAELPDGVEYIGDYAFAMCASLERMDIPAAVQRIGKGIVACCSSLSQIGLAPGNSSYALEGGGLYTADRSLMIAYPQALTGSYTVDSTTTVIGSDCFSESRLESIVLPEGLVTIENYAFYDTKNLQMPMLPDCLCSIGHYAFSGRWYSVITAYEKRGPQSIYIGDNVSYIGTEAFTGFLEKSYTVSEENSRYMSREGALLTASGDAMVDFATGKLKTYIVPDGVYDLDMSLMEQIGQINLAYDSYPCHLYIPDSVKRISGATIFSDDIIIHCSADSCAQEYADLKGFATSRDMDPVRNEYSADTENGVLRWLLTDNAATLVGYDGTDEVLVIPDTVNGLPVKTIGNGLNSLVEISGSILHEVIIPDGVQIISADAFAGCSELYTQLPDSVRVIGDRAFADCSVPFDHLPPYLEDLGERALGYGCRFINGVNIPKTLDHIAPGAFAGVAIYDFDIEEGNESYIEVGGMLYSNEYMILIAATMPDETGHVIIPDGTFAIGTLAFQGIPMTSVEIPSSVKIIAANAFSYCYTLESVKLSEGLETIGTCAFLYTGLTGDIDLPSTVEKIGDMAFFGSPFITSVSTGASTIGRYAFSYCSALGELELFEGVEEICEHAFSDTPVAYITLPDTLRIIGESAFSVYGDVLRDGESFTLEIGDNLTSIAGNAFGGLPVSEYTVSANNPEYASRDGFLTDKSGHTLVMCPACAKGAVSVPDGISEIAGMAFYSCANLSDVYLPDSVKVIRSRAFNTYTVYGYDKDFRIVLHFSAESPLIGYVLRNNWPYVID
ncbi:MAG: leucine-rich repeat protein [Lachnospiraceae bacterium]|nr:leucine-rich repeat protein [Lachnospiraceae bacterium]